ncbi:hypothetical protein BASA81_007517 [Batrachochytrium salamandrivorans]|nr:hypothetical protein BASA81_007517 [Batrachochytrium salamandrivorans]
MLASSVAPVASPLMINFRDAATHIPGLKPGKLFRTSVCFTPGPEITAIVDLRRRGAQLERWHVPENRPQSVVKRYHVPFVGSQAGLALLYGLPFAKKIELMCCLRENSNVEMVVGSHYFQSPREITQMYLTMTELGSGELFQIFQIFEQETNGQGAVAVHCVAGKDRTGIVVALLARLCDAEVAHIALDYSLSQANLLATSSAELGNDPFLADYKDGMLTSSPALAMERFLLELEHTYGSVRRFLVQKVGLKEQVLDSIVSRLKA